jgi:hypothetical protein
VARLAELPDRPPDDRDRAAVDAPELDGQEGDEATSIAFGRKPSWRGPMRYQPTIVVAA